MPVIIVSGEISDEVAALARQAGARGYVTKALLEHLVPAIQCRLGDPSSRRA